MSAPITDNPQALRSIIAHLEAALPLAERLCYMAREWHDAASRDFGRVLHAEPRERQAALAVLEAAKAAHGASSVTIRSRRIATLPDGRSIRLLEN